MTLLSGPFQDARIRTKTEETVGQQQKVPVVADTFVFLHLTASKAEILFRVLEERLDPPSSRYGLLTPKH